MSGFAFFNAVPPKGDLAQWPAAVVVMNLRREARSGYLDVITPGATRRLFLRGGVPVYCQSGVAGENAIDKLVAAHRITPEVAQSVRERMAQARATPEAALIMAQVLSQADALPLVRQVLSEVLAPLMAATQGSYAFTTNPQILAAVPQEPVEAGPFVWPAVQTYPEGVATRIFASEIGSAISVANLGKQLAQLVPGQQVLMRLATPQRLETVLALGPDIANQTLALALLGALVGVAAPVVAAQTTAVVVQQGVVAPVIATGPVSPEDQELRREIANKSRELEQQNLFERLGLPETATDADIKKAYFGLARKWHIDVYAGRNLGAARPELERIFAWISEAHELLCDEKKRSEYLIFIDRQRKGLPTDVGEILRAEQLFTQARSMVQRGQYLAAEPMLREAVQLNNSEPEFYAYLAFCAYKKGADKAEIDQLFEKALESDPKMPAALAYRGQMFLEEGRLQEAIRDLEQAQKGWGQDTSVLRNLRLAQKRLESHPPDSGKKGLFGKFLKK